MLMMRNLDMQSTRYKYFRWTGRTARITFAYVVMFPAFVGYWGYVTDVSFPHDLHCSEGEEEDEGRGDGEGVVEKFCGWRNF